MADVHELSTTVPSRRPSRADIVLPEALADLGPTAAAARSCPEARISRASVLSADCELASAVPAIDRPRAQRVTWSTTITFPAGPIELARVPHAPATFALLVIRGVLTRETMLSDRAMIELLLAGDVLSPWPPAAAGLLTETGLTALSDVRLAVLDHRFLKAAAVWPQLMIAIQRRIGDQQHRLAIHGAICQLPRVEQRVLAVLWLLAARTGVVTAGGTELHLTLTHDSLAQLTGSRRPTVSLAVKHLRDHGHLDRRDSGEWLLPSAPTRLAFEDLAANLAEV